LIFKNAKTNIHCTAPREIWVPRAKFDLGPLVIPSSNIMIRGPGPFSPGNFLNPRSHKWPNPAFWTSVDSYIYVYFTVIQFGPPLTEAPGKLAASPPMGGLRDAGARVGHRGAMLT
jgi:hypothetical protein